MNEQGSTDTHQHNGAHDISIHERPRRPVRPAPASRGVAGLSASGQSLIRRDISHIRSQRRSTAPEAIVHAIGWLSIAIGVAETVAPNMVADALGLDVDPQVIRARGVSELAAGAVLLSASRPEQKTRVLQTRMLGDIVDITAVATAITPRNRNMPVAASVAAGLVACLALDAFAAALINPR